MQECYLIKAGFCEPKHPLPQCSDAVPWVSGVIVGSNISLEFHLLKTHPKPSELRLQRCVQGQSGGTGPRLSLPTVPPVSSHHVTTPQAPRRGCSTLLRAAQPCSEERRHRRDSVAQQTHK